MKPNNDIVLKMGQVEQKKWDDDQIILENFFTPVIHNDAINFVKRNGVGEFWKSELDNTAYVLSILSQKPGKARPNQLNYNLTQEMINDATDYVRKRGDVVLKIPQLEQIANTLFVLLERCEELQMRDLTPRIDCGESDGKQSINTDHIEWKT